MKSWNELSMAEKADVMKLAIEGGVYDLNSIRSGYNEYAKGGDTGNKFPIGGPILIGTAARGAVKAAKQRLYENLSPIGYDDLSRVPKAILLNEPDFYHNTMKDMPVLDEIYAQYLGIPEESRHFNTRLEKSKYKPSQGGEDVTYYRLPQKTIDGRTILGDDHKYTGASDTSVDAMVFDATYMNPGENKQQLNTELGYYTVGRGRDNKGDYVSYYDKWDINPFSGRLQNHTAIPLSIRKTLKDINLDFGVPVNIYDRIYFDDYYGIKGDARGGHYLPEVIVTGKKHSIGGPLIEAAMNEYKKGGPIHIKPENRGKFTALKKRTGHSATWFKEHGTPAQKKMATFALNARHWKHELGGNLYEDGGGIWDKIVETLESIPSPEEVAKRATAGTMQYARQVFNGANVNPFAHDWMPELDDSAHTGGTAQRTYLLPRSWQEEEFLKSGYIKGKEGDYGLVKKAVGDRKLPIYQTAKDAITRDKLIPIGNLDNVWYGDSKAELEHPGSYPTAVYTDGQGNFYQKAWDLNDYGSDGGSTASFFGKIADFIGSPVVVTTGFQKIDDSQWNTGAILKDMMAKKGLVPTEINGKTEWTLPKVTVVGKRKKYGFGGNLYPGGGFMGLMPAIPSIIAAKEGKDFLSEAYHGIKQFIGLEDTEEELRQKRSADRYANSGYIGGEPRDTRQKYFDVDREFTDSVNSIAKRYGLNPSIVASRIAEEGPVDQAIIAYNDENNVGTQGQVLSDNGKGTHGPLWGLDDFYTRITNNDVSVTTTAPYTYKKQNFINEQGRTTESITSPQWWFGIEATAAEMKARRDKLKKNNPWMTNQQLDAATAMSFNYGESGVQKHINSKKPIPKRFNPYIKTK